MWVLLRPPRFGGAKHASDYDNRSRYRESRCFRSTAFDCDHGHGWRHGAAMQVTFVEGGVETYGILESDDVTSRIDERAKAVT